MLEDLIRRYAVVAIAAFALFVSALISLTGGWFQLSRVYPAERDFMGTRWWFQSATLRAGTNYGSCLIVGANPSGIRFSVLLPFRFGHPPLFFPWSELAVSREGRWIFRRVRLTPRRLPSISIAISERLFAKIEKELGGAIAVGGDA